MSPPDKRHAYVTFLTRNDGYLPGALVLASALVRQQTSADLVCLVTPEITRPARRALELLFHHVVGVEPFLVPHRRRQERQDRPYWFTRFHALRLGSNGDLGFAYEKLVILDADLLPLRRYDRLFRVTAPAGILNERKSHFLESDSRGRYIVPPGVERTGRWVWHRLYDPVCPHGRRIPKRITDRVLDDPSNMGVHGALLVVEPDGEEFRAIRRDVRRPRIRELVSDRFDWPDMQYITARWSGRWTNVDLRFCGLSGYPCLSVLHGTHFAGVKPWQLGRSKAVARFARYPDFRRWFAEYERLLAERRELTRVGRLRRLLEEVRRHSLSGAFP
ncbi:MAG: glycosyltransferase family protein [Planctomycetota bacterium]|jgi:glycogenin glucosyltransferase